MSNSFNDDFDNINEFSNNYCVHRSDLYCNKSIKNYDSFFAINSNQSISINNNSSNPNMTYISNVNNNTNVNNISNSNIIGNFNSISSNRV